MTDAEALYNYFSSFGINAYPSTAVPEDVVFPWISYEYKTDLPFSSPVGIALNLWFHTDSEAVPNTKVKEIRDAIGIGGIQLAYDEGTIWITAGSPFCISMNSESDTSIKQRQINLNLQFL